MSLPVVYLGISPTSRFGVAMANYTARLSRMWAWDAKSLKVIGFQDIKARAKLLDVSGDGEYVGYFVEALHRKQAYLAVSRPPYFHALMLRNGHYIIQSSITFTASLLVFTRERFEDCEWLRNLDETTQRHCPLRIIEGNVDSFPDETPPPFDGSFVSSYKRRGLAYQPWEGAAPSEFGTQWKGHDGMGREIWSDGLHVYADETPFLDLARQPFTEVVPPEWAKSWIAPRK
ncbi:MAG: hypothetical protein JSS65_12305 [Armatimonadetes bacterium]|nr:hypothetical protein [Armatimonadota bacterium]